MRKGINDEILKSSGFDIVGITDISEIESDFHPEIKRGVYKTAIIGGITLSKAVINTIKDSPSLLYKHHYKTINWILDQNALKIAKEIESLGWSALPIAASQIVDWRELKGHLSHRKVALYARLGWIGKSGLLIHPKFGPRVRYITILTDMKLDITPKPPLESQCGNCSLCIESCPAGAIKEDGIDKTKCHNQLKRFASIRGIGQLICGICIRACPVGSQAQP